MAEYIEKATLLNRVIIPSICSCVQGPTAERLKKFCIDTVNSISAADVAPVVHGRWAGTVCTACEESTSFYYDCNYCPWCGAKMDEEEHNGRGSISEFPYVYRHYNS